MKTQKIIAGVLALSVAGTMAIAASAKSSAAHVYTGSLSDVAIGTGDQDENNLIWYIFGGDDNQVNHNALGDVALTDIYGFKMKIEMTDTMKSGVDWIGGSLCWQSDSAGWKQVEWGTDGTKESTPDADGWVSFVKEEPLFTAADTYVRFIDQTYASVDITISAVQALDKDGNVLFGDTADSAPADPQTPADDNNNTDTQTPADNQGSTGNNNNGGTQTPSVGNSSKPNTNTGAEGIAVAAGVAVLAAGAVIVAKKRK